MPVPNRIASMAKDMKAWRRWLHRNPELGFELSATAAFVAARLDEFGVDEIHQGIAGTGIVAIVNGQAAGPTIGLRADMDALPIEEATDAKYASATLGRMHACGHDGHMAMLLGSARYLAETRNFAGRAALIFQPAEEDGGGGKVMVDEGIMERFDIAQVYAMHCAPDYPFGHLMTTPGPIMAAVDEFDVTFRGVGGHAAWPHCCTDPIPAALAFAQGAQTVVSRNHDPLDELVVSVTVLKAGTATNIVPETARVCGTVRTFAASTRNMAERRLRALADAQAAAYELTVETTYDRNYPATINDPDKTAFAMQVAQEIVGADRVDPALPPEMGAEDFSYMLQSRPGAYVFLGQGPGAICHHPAFDFNDATSPIGAAFFARLVERAQPLTRTKCT